MRSCSRCKEVRPIDDFDWKNVALKKKHSHCKSCRVVEQREWHRKNRDEVNRRKRERYTPEKGRKGNLRRYGISPEQYDEMLLRQSGACAICLRTDPTWRGRRHFHVDHDHQTGRVRGLLCHYCNIAIGNLDDNPSLLLKAIAYLEESQAK